MEKENKTMLQAVDEINKAAKGASLDNHFVLDMHEAEKIISDMLAYPIRKGFGSPKLFQVLHFSQMQVLTCPPIQP